MNVLVKGAGVAGLVAAFELAERGASVTVVETGAGLGAGASWCAGGMLAPYCEREHADEDVVTLGAQSADWWEAALPGAVHRRGTLVVAPPRDTRELDRFAGRTDCWERVGAQSLAALEPDLAERFRTGLYFAREAHLDPRRALAGLHRALIAKGVRCLFGTSSADTPADLIVDCTGIAGRAALPGLRGVRGEMLYLETADVTLSRPVRLLHPRIPVYVVPRGDGRFMVGATMIESSDAGPVTARSVMELLNSAYTLHPAFGEARVIETAAGVRPAFADNLPKIVRDGRVVFLNGFHRHGFLLAPAMARRLADLAFGNGEEACTWSSTGKRLRPKLEPSAH